MESKTTLYNGKYGDDRRNDKSIVIDCLHISTFPDFYEKL